MNIQCGLRVHAHLSMCELLPTRLDPDYCARAKALKHMAICMYRYMKICVYENMSLSLKESLDMRICFE